MTDNSPKVRASADLDVISPAPLHPPSPIIVPALQDQADTYSNLASHGNSSVLSIVTSVSEPPGIDNVDVPPISSHDNLPKPIQQTGALGPEAVGQNNMANGSGGNGITSVATHNPVEEVLPMLETPTHTPRISDADQHGSKLNKLIRSPDIPTLVIHQPKATSTFEDNSAVSQDARNPNPGLWSDSLVQPLQEFRGSGSDGVGINPIQQRGEHETTQRHVPPNMEYPIVDIQAMVDNIKAHAVAPSPAGSINPTIDNDGPSQSIPLPPKPPMGQPNHPQAYPFPEGFVPHAQGSFQSSTVSLSLSSATSNSGYAIAPPGTFPVIPSVAASIPNNAMAAAYPRLPPSESQQQNWDTFLREERRHLSDAKWDKFPDGSRLFVGNLFCERVSKRDVFNIFSKYGRLAQISLKPSYGFVQYYTVEDGQAAMNNLQGIEVHGKRLNLEFSRPQKRDNDAHRNSRTKRESNRHNSNKERRDDRRPSRQPSPARVYQPRETSYDSSDHGRPYQDGYYYSSRRRSQSPGYESRDSYRHRTPSPHRRYPTEADLDLPRRTGADVPDIQFLLLEEVRRDFVTYVQDIFHRFGLRVSVMSLSYRFPRDAVIRRQARDGVHAVVELDYRAERLCKIQLQIFDRSAGSDIVQFHEYQDLDPEIAAQLVLRAKSQSQISPSFLGRDPYLPVGYPPPVQNHYIPPSTNDPGARGAPLDPVEIQRILGSLNGHRAGPQMDINAVLATLRAAPNRMRPSTQHATSYGRPVANTPPGNPYTGNTSRQVEDIMDQLERFRR